MTEFQLDTSGVVYIPAPLCGRIHGYGVTWDDFDLLQQGYVEALLRDFNNNARPAGAVWTGTYYGFSDLAPETVQKIIRDCAALQAALSEHQFDYSQGWCFWNYRNGRLEGPDLVRWSEPFDTWFLNASREFPPLTLTLGEDGLIYFGKNV